MQIQISAFSADLHSSTPPQKNPRHFGSSFLVRTGMLLFCLLALACGAAAWSQSAHPGSQGHGAMSAQDIARYASLPAHTEATAADPADQVCARAAAGSVLASPAELKSVNGVLELTLQLKFTTDTQGLPRYCFVTPAGLQSPTLRVNPGDQLIIHFQNQLPATLSSAVSYTSSANGGVADNMAGMNMTLSAKDAATASTSSGACNGAMGTSVSNIHFHGTNATPLCGQDEVVHTLVQPGQTFDYNVLIPANEPPGLYWYHPHPHGISESQVQGGATGALIVEGLQNVDPSLAGLPERTFVARDQLVPASESNASNVPAWDVSINFVPVTFPGYTPAVIQTPAGEKELWRFANTSADTILNLQYLVNGAQQTMEVVAIDGYPIASGSSGMQSSSQTTILLPPGARAEFVVTTPAAGVTGQLSSLYWDTGPDGDFDPARTLASVVGTSTTAQAFTATSTAGDAMAGMVMSGAVSAMRLPASTGQHKVTRFAALATATPVAQRNLYFSEVLQNPADPNSPTNFFITEQGHTPALFTMGQAPDIIVHSGTVEDWVIENRAMEDHIFHIHQIHFQVLEVNGEAVNDPAVRDTQDLPYWSGTGPYPSVKVRMDFRDPNIIGTFVYHCHILQHEDSGMMGEIQVLGSGLFSSVVVAASAASTTPGGTLTLTANVAGSSASAAPTGYVQFQIDGLNIGSLVPVTGGVATLTTSVNGNVGSDSVTAFYQGDATYSSAVSSAVPVTISSFAFTTSGASAAVGAAALANIAVTVANNFTAAIQLTCTMPASLKESACFIDPSSITGSGQLSLRVNTTPAHPLSSKADARPFWFLGSGGATLACVFLLGLPRFRGRNSYASSLVIGFAILAGLMTAIGCGSGGSGTDPGTTAGSYVVVVSGTGGTGTGQYTSSVNVPITIH